MIWNIEKIQLFQPNMSFRLVGPFRDLHFLFGYFWFFFSLSQRYLNYIKNADTSAIVCHRSSFLYMALHSISVRDLAQVHNQVLHFFFLWITEFGDVAASSADSFCVVFQHFCHNFVQEDVEKCQG